MHGPPLYLADGATHRTFLTRAGGALKKQTEGHALDHGGSEHVLSVAAAATGRPSIVRDGYCETPSRSERAPPDGDRTYTGPPSSSMF